jgi:type II secretory pathway pseudopilin PulG
MPSRSERRRRAQAGSTLIELLVSVMIVGLALTILVGAFSTGLLDATLAKRNAGMTAAQQYELEKIEGSGYGTLPTSFSDCFAIDSAAEPTQNSSCPAGTSLRADVTETDSLGVQLWTVKVVTYPSLGTIGSTVSIYKVNR